MHDRHRVIKPKSVSGLLAQELSVDSCDGTLIKTAVVSSALRWSAQCPRPRWKMRAGMSIARTALGGQRFVVSGLLAQELSVDSCDGTLIKTAVVSSALRWSAQCPRPRWKMRAGMSIARTALGGQRFVVSGLLAQELSVDSCDGTLIKTAVVSSALRWSAQCPRPRWKMRAGMSIARTALGGQRFVDVSPRRSDRCAIRARGSPPWKSVSMGVPPTPRPGVRRQTHLRRGRACDDKRTYAAAGRATTNGRSSRQTRHTIRARRFAIAAIAMFAPRRSATERAQRRKGVARSG